jgi:hypothetical protein
LKDRAKGVASRFADRHAKESRRPSAARRRLIAAACAKKHSDLSRLRDSWRRAFRRDAQMPLMRRNAEWLAC